MNYHNKSYLIAFVLTARHRLDHDRTIYAHWILYSVEDERVYI